MDQFVNNPNRVPALQKKFQSGSEFIFLKTSQDRAVYKALMFGSTVTLAFVAYSFVGMATGSGKKPRK